MLDIEETEASKAPFSWQPPSNSSFPLFWSKSSCFHFLILDDVISKQRIEKIINDYGGITCQTVVCPSTIILVPENSKPKPQWGPVFSRKWVKDCINSNCLMDLNDYLIEGCEKPSISEYDGNLTTALFLEKFKFRKSFLHVACFSNEPTTGYCVRNRESCKIFCDKCQASIYVHTPKVVNDPKDIAISVKDVNTEMLSQQTVEKANYSDRVSSSSDFNCLDSNYNIRTNDCAGPKSPKKVMKRRLPYNHNQFLENDEVNLDEPENISEKYDTNTRIENNLDLSKLKRQKKNDDEHRNKLSIQEQSRTEKANTLTKHRENDPDQCKNQNNFKAASAVEDNATDSDSESSVQLLKNLKKFNIVNKHSKTKFDRQEKASILRYIIAKRAFCRLKSDALYKEMESRNICPRRTYQSMKNHFLKSIIYELDTFDFLTDDVKKLLRGF